MKTAKATYRVTSWDEDPVYELDDGTKLTRASVKGSYEGTNARARQEVVADSGTGDLSDLSGEGAFEAPPGHEGSLELSYELG